MKLTVRELVTFGRFPYSGGRTTPEDQRIIDQAIAYMELEEFQDRFIDELSGGQRQRASSLHPSVAVVSLHATIQDWEEFDMPLLTPSELLQKLT